MVNDLVNIENIQTDFCIYEIEYETREYDYHVNMRGRLEAVKKAGRPKWIIQKTFQNLRDKYKTAIKTEYRYAIDRQIEIFRRYGLDISTMLRLLNRLSNPLNSHIPLSLQPRISEVHPCKTKRAGVKLTRDEKESYHSIKLYKYTFRAQLVSYLIQKREDLFQIIGSVDDRENYDRIILAFRDMNTDTGNCITFNQAVDNLYNKTINTMGDDNGD